MMTQIEEQKTNRAVWQQTLYNNKFDRCWNFLRTSRGLCNIGVACEMSELAKWERNSLGFWTYLGEEMLCPPEVMYHYGLRTPNGAFYLPNGNLDNLNDFNDRGMRFSESARLILSEPPGLFISEEFPHYNFVPCASLSTR